MSAGVHTKYTLLYSTLCYIVYFFTLLDGTWAVEVIPMPTTSFVFTYLSCLWLATQGRVFTRILIAGNFEIGQVPSDLFSYTLFSDIP